MEGAPAMHRIAKNAKLDAARAQSLLDRPMTSGAEPCITVPNHIVSLPIILR
jgi:hypothetical protein